MQQHPAVTENRAWDPVVRVMHWSLVIYFTVAYWTGGDWLGLHAHAGYCLLLILLVRLLWGWCGSVEARFTEFVVAPRALVSYLRSLAQSRTAWVGGHDPAGGWMIVAILLTLCVTALSGVVLFALEKRGPLAGSAVADWHGGLVEAIHHTASDLALVLVCVHVLGVIFMSAYTRRNLVAPMIRKKRSNHG